MGEPGREPVAGIVALRALLGRGAERIGNALGGALVVGREGDADMAVVEDRVVLAIGLLDLVEALGDQEGADAVAGHEGERWSRRSRAGRAPGTRRASAAAGAGGVGAVSASSRLGQPAADLVEHQADQRLGAADVRGRNDQIERDRRSPSTRSAMRQSQRDGDRRPRSGRGRGRGTTSRSTARPSARSRDLLSTSRAAEATTGWTTARRRAEMIGRHHPPQRRGRTARCGSDRKVATRASVFSSSA